MSFLVDLGDGLRTILRAAGLTVVSSSAVATDNTVTVSVALVVGPDDADQEGATGATGGGACDVRVTLLYRGSINGNTTFPANTSETAQRVIGTLRNTTVAGYPVSWVRYDYSADLGFGDRGRPEATDNFMVRATRPALV